MSIVNGAILASVLRDGSQILQLASSLVTVPAMALVRVMETCEQI